jgi:predicted MPP superfamily phosphohydrolase
MGLPKKANFSDQSLVTAANKFFEPQLVALGLSEDQISQQTLMELKRSLETVSDALDNSAGFGVLRLAVQADMGMVIVQSDTRYHIEMTIVPILLERKRMILDRIDILRNRQEKVELQETEHDTSTHLRKGKIFAQYEPVHILHISDIHLGTETDARRYRTQLQADLRLELDIGALDYVVISGDVTQTSTPEEYDAAKLLLNGLIETFDVPPAHMIIAPGNHDLSWGLARESYDFVRVEDLRNKVPEKHCIPAGDKGMLVRDGMRYRKRFKHFASFHQQITGIPYPLDFEEQGLLRVFPDHRLLFLNLNSSWEIDDHYRDRSGIHMNALSRTLDCLLKHDYTSWLKLAVWHHPVTGREMMNDEFLEQLAVHGFQICMHGHIHEAHEDVYKYDDQRGLHIVGAGTFGAPTRSQVPGIPLQYNLLVLDREMNVITVNTRMKTKPDGAWMADARWGDKNNPIPRYTIDLQD